MTKIGFITFFIALFNCCNAQQMPSSLPSFSSIYPVYDDKLILQEQLPSKGKIVLIFYDPGCGHCQQLGAGVSKYVDKLKDASFFFISMHDKEYVDGFINMFAKGLKGKKNVSFWKDHGVEFIEKMVPENYPASYIYDGRTKKMIKSFQGESDITKIMPFIQQQ
ncbi:redoxin [Sphingobacterium griseoflavum]|uniref:Thioredoxin domain-containing protein n=1 Tax=Sphingobacterium griseoflavum TaxID=1474952 RepID=A0ABQ3I439_9SPHI|nr:redoxin [Sphingobacterium griseoflavum]GHE48727.1 hypothetical protein GCM10017764_34700 [Sphingobacterium griseoflavum]